MTDWLMDGLFGWLGEKVVDLLSSLLAPTGTVAVPAPDVTVLPQVKSIADKSALIVNACFILAVISVGIAAMVGDSVETRYGIKRLSRGWSSGSCSPSSGCPDRRTDHDRQRPDRTPTVVVVVACH